MWREEKNHQSFNHPLVATMFLTDTAPKQKTCERQHSIAVGGTQKHCVCVNNTHRTHGTKGLVVSEMRTC